LRSLAKPRAVMRPGRLRLAGSLKGSGSHAKQLPKYRVAL